VQQDADEGLGVPPNSSLLPPRVGGQRGLKTHHSLNLMEGNPRAGRGFPNIIRSLLQL